MKYPSLSDFIKQHLRFKQHWNKKVIDLTNAQWQELSEDTHLSGMEYAKGSKFKVFETANFGWIVFEPETLTPNGHTPARRILKY